MALQQPGVSTNQPGAVGLVIVTYPQSPPSQTIASGGTALVEGPLVIPAGVTVTIAGTGRLRIL